MKHFVSTLIITMLIVACSPQLPHSQLSLPQHFDNATANRASTDSVPYNWWYIFGDSLLNTLIERAIDNNRDLAIAASKVEQAQLMLSTTRSQYLPSFTMDIAASGERGSNRRTSESYTIGPAMKWEISLFGALRNAEGAARAELMQSLWNRRNVELSLAAQVATTYFTILQYVSSLDIATHTLELRRTSAALIDSMFRYGMSDGVAVAQAHSLVHSTQADIPQYERAIEQSMISLRVLLGESHSSEIESDILNRELTLATPEIPAGLPSDLLYRRADVMESFSAMERSAYQAGVARSARFPTITLTATGGIAGYSIKSLTSESPWAWSLAGEIITPLFAFKRLKRQEESAIESYKQSLLDYEQTVIEALGEVENTLKARETLYRQLSMHKAFVSSNAEIEHLTNELFKSGLDDYLSVIDARRTLYSSQLELVSLTAECNIACINLIKALGGGFDNEPTVERHYKGVK